MDAVAGALGRLAPSRTPDAGGSTEALVLRARSGDRDAYALLFHRFHDEIYRFATRRLGDPLAGQDVAADTFADAFGALRRFRWQGVPFEGWLYTIARRRIVDLMRKRAREEQQPPPPQAVDDHSGGVVQSMHLRALIAQLPDTERDVIELRFMEDLNVNQTARRLGKNPGAVRVAQHRGIARLRTLLAQSGL